LLGLLKLEIAMFVLCYVFNVILFRYANYIVRRIKNEKIE